MIPEIEAKTLVYNVSKKSKHWFAYDYNMNLYRGCSHGCIYCDSRSECYGIDDFDMVRVKKDAISKLSKELLTKRKKGVLAIGSMSDPYNPFERELEITRQALDIIEKTNFGLSIITKSPLITRDIDILKKITAKQDCLIKMTVTCANDSLSKIIEPRVAPSSARFKALKELSANGLFCGVLLMPILPYINDTEENIRTIVQLAAKANVKFIYTMLGVTLRDRQRTHYYQEIDKLSPGLSSLYINQFQNQYSCSARNHQYLYQVFVEECQKYHLLYKMKDIIKAYKTHTYNSSHQQLSLF